MSVFKNCSTLAKMSVLLWITTEMEYKMEVFVSQRCQKFDPQKGYNQLLKSCVE